MNRGARIAAFVGRGLTVAAYRGDADGALNAPGRVVYAQDHRGQRAPRVS